MTTHSTATPAALWNPAYWIVVFGGVAALLAALMLAYALGGTSQEYFESIHVASDYAAALRDRSGALRVVFGLDGMFLLAYTLFFVAYAAERHGRAPALLLRLTLGAVLIAAALDAIENFSILGMVHAAEQGRAPAQSQIASQYVLSAVKFTFGYVAAIGLALTYPRETALGRLVALSTGIAFPIVGVAAFVVPEQFAGWLAIARVGLFVSGYALSAVVFWPQARSPHR